MLPKLLRTATFLCTICLSITAFGQTPISGTINIYKEVTAITGRGTVEVNGTSGLNAGDKVLIIQMQGAQITTSETDSFGSVYNYNGAGSHEWGIICDITGTTVVFEKEFINYYDEAGSVQLVSIPQFTDAEVTNTLTAQPWNGTTGGILIFEVSGTLTLNATIELTDRGFNGGQHDESTYNCIFLDDFDGYGYDLSTGYGAMKGEGVANYDPNINAGRGANANGGGGGNDHNSGGGGGANIAYGGQGGENDEPGNFNCDGYWPGIGGKGITHGNDRVFLGGGGGAGHSNSQWNSSGGTGGGLVIITANTLVGNNQIIRSNGMIGESGFGDGAGGGGAGGTIVLDVQNYSGNLSLQAIGGDGGTSDGFTSNRCFGPGGGGSGGAVWYASASTPSGVTTNFPGGGNGVVGNSTAPCLGDAQNAAPGSGGTEEFNYVMPTGFKGNQECYYVPQLAMDSVIDACDGQTVTLFTPVTNVSYLWSTGDTTQSIDVTTADTYILIVDNGQYLTCDSTIVNFGPAATTDLGPDISVCIDDSVVLDAGTNALSYLWSTNDTTQTITVTTAGLYEVTVSNGGCSSTDSVMVDFLTPPDSLSSNIARICSATFVTLDAENPGLDYLWSTGETTQTIDVVESGSYTVSIANGGCVLLQEIEVERCDESLTIPNTITPNGDGANDTWIIRGLEIFDSHVVEIFNRNGQMVYSSTEYENQWDGAGLPATTYYYVIDVNDGEQRFAGTITILNTR